MTEGSFSFRVEPDKHRGYVSFSGLCKGKEFLGAMAALFGSTQWRPDYDSIWDMSQISSLDFQLSDVDKMMEQSDRLRNGGQSGRLAAVVTDPNHLIIARLIAARLLKAGREAQIFSDLASVNAWLDG